MNRPFDIVWMNGAYLPLSEAHISVLDRGFLFGDGVYEVIPAYNGRLFRLQAHLDRLANSLAGIRLANPYDQDGWKEILDGLVSRNADANQSIYLQITRGSAAGRDHAFPADTAPNCFAMASPLQPLPDAVCRHGVRALTLEDIRWRRCDIKSTALLANVLLGQQAKDTGCAEAILVRDGLAVEGTASSLFACFDGVIVTPPKSHDILPGVTRDLVLELAGKNGIPAKEADIPADSLPKADEIWISSSTREVVAVSELDGQPVGGGAPGPLWRRVYDLVQQYKAAF